MNEELVYWILGALFTVLMAMFKYLLDRFNALETQSAKDRADYIKHQDMDRYMKPLESQMGQLNGRLDKLLDLQIEVIKKGSEK